MRSFRTRLAALALAAIGCTLLSPSVGRAEVKGFHINLTPYAGTTSWANQTNAQNKALYGGRLGINFSSVLGIEGDYGKSSSQVLADQGQYAWTSGPGPAAASPIDNKFTHMSADLILNMVPSGKVDPYLLAGWSQQKFEPDSAGAESKRDGFNAGAGFKFHFNPRVALRLEARDMIYSWSDAEQKTVGAPATGSKQNSWAFTGGLLFSIGGDAKAPDADMDGIPDKKDQCPNTPAGAVVDAKGCPVDSDGDGVPDGIDTCPNTPKGAQVDEKGCPKDSDGDGVFDGIDQCDNTQAGCKVDEKGCPVDSDGDGVCDGLDQCANTPAGARVDEKGCPVDSDADGVPDGLDKCPNTPAGARVDVNGCPIEITAQAQEMLDKGEFTSRDILFDTGKATIKPESEPKLQAICQILQQWPSLQIEVQGHTDSQGSNAFNQKLSEQRAQSVRDWFVANCNGLTPGNYTFVGYGETKPVASNATAKGRAQNRRVAFKVMNPEELKRIRESRQMLMNPSGGK